jgi:hypothetical protein
VSSLSTFLVTLILAAALLFGCNRVGPKSFRPPDANFFPLGPNSSWDYLVEDEAAHQHFTVIDRVIGNRYIASLNLSGTLVEEYCDMERADQNEEPMVYARDHGFLMRVSALVNSQHRIEVSPFGAVKEGQFLPSPLLADHNWQDQFFPLGHVAVSPVLPFKVVISSRSYGETDEIVVPAGRFHWCIRVESSESYEGGPAPDSVRKLNIIDWYAPNVGLIESLVREATHNHAILSRKVLREYHITAAAKGL